MRAKSVQLKEAVTIPGTKILGEMSIQPEKHPDAVISVSDSGVVVKSGTIVGFIPFSNIKSIVLQEEDNGRSEQTAKKSK
jgi:hypothetical protein